MISIVKDTPGVTRDRIYAEVTWLDKEFTMIDTIGLLIFFLLLITIYTNSNLYHTKFFKKKQFPHEILEANDFFC